MSTKLIFFFTIFILMLSCSSDIYLNQIQAYADEDINRDWVCIFPSYRDSAKVEVTKINLKQFNSQQFLMEYDPVVGRGGWYSRSLYRAEPYFIEQDSFYAIYYLGDYVKNINKPYAVARVSQKGSHSLTFNIVADSFPEFDNRLELNYFLMTKDKEELAAKYLTKYNGKLRYMYRWEYYNWDSLNTSRQIADIDSIKVYPRDTDMELPFDSLWTQEKEVYHTTLFKEWMYELKLKGYLGPGGGTRKMPKYYLVKFTNGARARLHSDIGWLTDLDKGFYYDHDRRLKH